MGNLPDTVCEVVGHPGYPGNQANTLRANSETMRCLGRERYAQLLSDDQAPRFIEGEHYVGTDLLHVIEDTTRVRDIFFLYGDPVGLAEHRRQGVIFAGSF